MTIPRILYGTAWKEERTATLVELALREGFRGIDTANQRKHYCDAAVGDAIAASGMKREDLFLQTKFTFRRGQDHRLPYDPDASLAEQVRQSMASSLEHLRTNYVNSYVLHGPSSGGSWTGKDDEVWQAMLEELEMERTRALGISNVSLLHLEEMARRGFMPNCVQNRCLARMGWDRDVRDFCRNRRIVYEGFWLLTGNVEAIQSRTVQNIAASHRMTAAQTIFAFACSAGILPLTGTSSATHMREDLASSEIPLSTEEVLSIESVFAGNALT